MYTLIDVLNNKKNDNLLVTFIEGSNNETFFKGKELREKANKVLAFLQSKGIQPKEELVFQIEDNETFIIVFWACLLGGIIPVPLAQGRTADHFHKLFKVWGLLKKPHLIVSPQYLSRIAKEAVLSKTEELFLEIKENTLYIEELFSVEKEAIAADVKEDDIAYIQFSSGSTGNPKGVTLTHKNLITNIRGILDGINAPSDGDLFFSWMPLTHDMGLIGFHLTPFLAGWNHYIMSTSLFIRRPLLWLEKISEHRITFSASPNFGYSYLIRRFKKDSIKNLDLSSLRIIVNGAEPISADLCNEFYNLFSNYGLRSNVIFPVYGLAEASLAVTFSRPIENVKSIEIDRKYLGMGDRVHVINKDKSLSLVNVGKPIKGCRVRIVDSNKVPVEEGIIGEIQIEGNNVTAEYYGNEIATHKTIGKDGWLSTGDMGFFYEEDLFVSGRLKDVIFINGQNYYAHDLEKILDGILDIELGKVVVAGHVNSKGENKTIVFVYFKKSLEKFIDILIAVKKKINFVFGFEPNDIIPVKEIPKTTSGKVQRYKLIERYSNSEFDNVLRIINERYKALSENKIHDVPKTPVESKIIKTWQTVLGHRNFGISDKFFEVGGNSLKGAQVLNIIQKEFDIELGYDQLYEKQTVKDIAELLENNKSRTIYQTIPIQEKEEGYSLTSMQERLYYFWQLSPEATAYNVPLAICFNGCLDVGKLEEALNGVVERHQVLRTYFTLKNQKTYQAYVDSIQLTLKVTEIESKNLDSELKNRVTPFDLHQAPLFRIELLKESKNKHVLFIDAPHIIIDGISMSLLLKEVYTVYQGNSVDALEIQYKDYAAWRSDFLGTKKGSAQQKYWIERLGEDLSKSELPTDFKRPSIFNYEGEKYSFSINQELTDQLKAVAHKQNVSLYVVLLAVYTITLSKYIRSEEVVVGVPVSGRGHYQLQGLLGMFVNNLVLRNFPVGEIPFTEYLQQIKKNVLNDLTNQSYPFSELIKDLNIKNDPSGSPFFNTMFVYQNMDIPVLEMDGLKTAPYFFDSGIAKFDLTLEIIEMPEKMEYYIEFAKALFKRESIIAFAEHYKQLIDQVLTNPNQSIADLTLVSKETMENYFFGNKKTEEYTSLKVHELISSKAKNYLNSVAVSVNKNTELSYADLERKSSLLAKKLQEKGVKRNVPVAIIFEKHIGFVVSVLAVLKAEGCFIPIEANYPEDRIQFIVEDCGAEIALVTEAISKNSYITEGRKLTRIEGTEVVLLERVKGVVMNAIEGANHLAYMIYTSGSTGKPKGVKVAHSSLMNYLEWATKAYSINENSTFPLYTSIAFDLTLTSIFLPLISGSTLKIYQETGEKFLIESVLADNQVTVLKATPSHLKMIKDSFLLKKERTQSKLEILIVGGEALDSQLAGDIMDFFEGKIQLFNEYGPTETTIGCVVHEYNPLVDKSNNVPIGRAIANTQVYVLDKYQKPVPLGIAGELYISGDGVSEGYLNREELTKEKFIPNPFIPEQLMYRSGDLVKRKLDGNLEYLGRLDDQVKINGHRVELGEIEKLVHTHKQVKNVVAVYKEEKPLWVYLTLSNEEEVEKVQEEIKLELRKQLPDYMVPKQIIVIDEIPLTINGKVAYNQLPNPIQVSNKELIAPTSKVAELLVEAWKEILGNSTIGITNNFYEEGGDSIKAIQIASRLYEKNIKVNAKDILTYPNIQQLMNYVEIVKEADTEEELTGKLLEINPIQHWFFDRKLQNPNFYTQSVLLRWEDKIEEELISKTFIELFNYHDTLRLSYNEKTQTLYYRERNKNLPFELESFELKGKFTDLIKEELPKVLVSVKSSMKINSTLLKVAIITIEAVDYLFITAHHLIVDGVSWRILLNDINQTYKAVKDGADVRLPKKSASLITYQNEIKELSRQLSEQEIHFWKEIKQNDFTIYPTEIIENKVKEQKIITTELSKEDTSFLLKEANTVFNTNAEILLIVALTKTLTEEYKTNKVTIELEGHGRDLEAVNTSRTIGWFTSLFPLCFEKNPSIKESIKDTKDLIKSLPDGGMHYGILKYLNNQLNKEKTKNNILFNYLGEFSNETSNDVFSLVNEYLGVESDPENETSALLEFNLIVLNNTLKIQAHYIHNEETQYVMEKIVNSFKANILEVLSYLKNEEDIHFTSSDFEAAYLDNEDLKVLFE